MELVKVEREGEVWIIRMLSGRNPGGHWENTFQPDMINQLHRALDLVEASQGPRALVLTSQGAEDGNKFFSNGHDVHWMETCAKANGVMPGSQVATFVDQFYALLLRFMTAPFITVAAINGHAFAGGCLLAIAQDYRIMRSDRGFLCMNEIDMGLIPTQPDAVIKPGVILGADQKMTNVLLAKLTPLQVRALLLDGTRLTGEAALSLGVVDHVVADVADLIPAAINFASRIAARGSPPNHTVVSTLKTELVRDRIPAILGQTELHSKL